MPSVMNTPQSKLYMCSHVVGVLLGLMEPADLMCMMLGAVPSTAPAPWQTRWVRSIRSATVAMSTTKRLGCITSEVGTMNQFTAGS